MRLFAVSDLHVDFEPNRRWVKNLSNHDYQEDALIVAGDITDDCDLLIDTFSTLKSKFNKIIFVPGNHDVWVHRCTHHDSMEKFYWILEMAHQFGVCIDHIDLGSCEVIPLYSWYDYTFASLNDQLKGLWSDFRFCKWSMTHQELSAHFHGMNESVIRSHVKSKTTVSVSHFMPSIELLPSYIPSCFNYLWPVLGSTVLGEQVKKLRPDVHVYGHSHVNTRKLVDGVLYVNNALGYPNEKNQSTLIEISLSERSK